MWPIRREAFAAGRRVPEPQRSGRCPRTPRSRRRARTPPPRPRRGGSRRYRDCGGGLRPPDRNVVVAAEEQALAIGGEGRCTERFAAPGKTFSRTPVATRQMATGIGAAGLAIAMEGEPAPVGREREIERPDPRRIERDDHAPPAGRQVADADLPPPATAASVDPSGEKTRRSGRSFVVGIDPGRPLAVAGPRRGPGSARRRRPGSARRPRPPTPRRPAGRVEIVRVIRPSMASRRVSRPSGSRTAKNRPSGEAMTKPNPAT